jgi:trimeric autotransporter adhesin
MNPLNELKKFTALISVALSLACFGLLPAAQAVVPPPDGGYPGNNTAEGTNALFSLTTGLNNTALGGQTLYSNTGGNGNTATGLNALYHNTTGGSNTANGRSALFSNTTGLQNTATGVNALTFNSTGSQNTANGYNALDHNTTGVYNTANGVRALFSNTTGDGNTATGAAALFSNTTADYNTANGYQALRDHSSGSANTAIGYQSLARHSVGDENTATGYGTLAQTGDGYLNSAFGASALASDIGFGALGSANTAIGAHALVNNTSGNHNTALGVDAGFNVSTASHVICIGANVTGENVSNSCYIGQIFDATSSRGIAVFINSDGKLGTTTSSSRFKDDIKPMERVSEALFALKPVTFRYKKEIDPAGMQQFGLVAEQVEKVNPDLVVRDKEGKPYSVRYEQVNAMLLNEFLKEHRKNEEQEATIARQQKQIEALTAGLQKVSAQLEVIRPASQTALNNP